ncbi:MAG: hypothetical protein ABII00_14155 [Elusimicrobiota bacterium]
MRRLWTRYPGARGVSSYPQAVELFLLRCRSKNLSQHSLATWRTSRRGTSGPT